MYNLISNIMEENFVGNIMFLLVVYVFFTLYSTIAGFENKKQSKTTLLGLAVVAIFTIGIFGEEERSVFEAVAYLLPLYFLYNFVQILGNTIHKRLWLHMLNIGFAGIIAILLIQ